MRKPSFACSSLIISIRFFSSLSKYIHILHICIHVNHTTIIGIAQAHYKQNKIKKYIRKQNPTAPRQSAVRCIRLLLFENARQFQNLQSTDHRCPYPGYRTLRKFLRQSRFQWLWHRLPLKSRDGKNVPPVQIHFLYHKSSDIPFLKKSFATDGLNGRFPSMSIPQGVPAMIHTRKIPGVGKVKMQICMAFKVKVFRLRRRRFHSRIPAYRRWQHLKQ